MPRTGLIAVFMTMLWTLTGAAQPPLTCGATLGSGGVYTLTADLTCPEGVPALTLLDQATLDLGGYTLSAAGGVLLSGYRITVRNGAVADCSAVGWCLYNYDEQGLGDEGTENLLHDLELAGGVNLLGDRHRAARVRVGAPGFNLSRGHHGRFDRIEAISTWGGFARIGLSGNGNWLTRSRVRHVVDVPPPYASVPSVDVDGEGNVVVGIAIEGAQVGIAVLNATRGQPNLIVGVQSTDATVVDAQDRGVIDPADGRYGCDDNRWLFNTFATADPPCLLEPPRTIGVGRVDPAHGGDRPL